MKDLTVQIDDVQSLLLKLLRPTADALPKFIGEDAPSSECLNVIALKWESPDPFFSSEMLTFTEEKIEKFFAEFGIQLKPVIFCDVAVPWALIDRYR
jgi:hypothetical protein